MPSIEDPGLRELKQKLSEEEESYAQLLAQLDVIAQAQLPYELDSEIPSQLGKLNASWEIDPSKSAAPKKDVSPPGGLKGLLRRIVRRLLEPELAPLQDALARQQAFNSFTVQFLNRYMDAAHRHALRLREFSSVLVRYAQRIDRLADAKDRLYAQLGNTRSDLLLDGMDKRIESISLGLRRAQDRLDSMMSSVDLARSELRSLQNAMEPPLPRRRKRTAPPAPPPSPFEQREYVAFEQRFRGASEEIRERLIGYVKHFNGSAPIVELGCGRGEFLELLRDAGLEGRGVDGNAEMVNVCRERGLTVEEGDLLSYLSGLDEESVGGIFAAQVVEHLPPAILREALTASYRALRKGGRIVLETVNTKSVLALIESFYRDLTHQKPLHPETLDFLLRSCGFREVLIEYRNPVSERSKLLSVTSDDPSTRTLNDNFRKLNALLFGDQDYAAIATK
ncbi:MAG TPA: class I SAM-dependent methyltransferase [Vicinamibacteria bacterium]|nr:class I SAM-dependent methyltransferase [Vicinamibacteria bacterium]